MPFDHEIADILRFEVPGANDPPYREDRLAIERMMRGALQHAAASLLDQIPQRATGRHDLTGGALRYAKHLEEEHARLIREEREAKKAKRNAAASRKRG